MFSVLPPSKNMTKAVFSAICSAFFICGGVAAVAQTTSTTAAVDEAVRREADRLQLRQKIADAGIARAKGDLLEAARLYQDSFSLANRIGQGIDVERAEVVSGLVSVRTSIAHEARKVSDFRLADDQLAAALKADPRNPELLALK